jgi:Peptidase A4 family
MQTSRFRRIAVTGCVLAVTGALHAQQRKHDVNRVLRESDGTVQRGVSGYLISGNWSGYAQDNYLTNVTYTSASFTWIVPTVSFVAHGFELQQASAIWVGIGGDCENSSCRKEDSTLIQLGTEQDVNLFGQTNYYPWYEVLPASETAISETVEPGDQMFASLTCITNCTSGATQEWTLTMQDLKRNWTFTKTLPYKSSLLSVEWIVEAPTSIGVLPMADFGTATLSAALEDSLNPGLSGAQAIYLQDPRGQTTSVSMPAGGDAFNACWGAGSTFVACSASAN